MKDLIRNYKLLLKRRESTDSESQPLMSSNSTSSFGATTDCMFQNSDTTDYESEKQPIINTATPLISPKSLMRRPFCFPSTTYETPPAFEVYNCTERNYDTLQYFTKRNGILNLSDTSLIHGSRSYDSLDDMNHGETHNSVVTIFAIWNTIMGSSLLAMPWGIEKAGLVPGIAIIILIAAVCLYTCYIILKVNENHGLIGQLNEVSDLCRMLIGKWAEILAKTFSLIVLIGANTVYWILMSNFFYHTVYFIYSYVFSSTPEVVIQNVTVICPKDIVYNTTNSSIAVGSAVEESIFNKIWNLHTTVPVILAFVMFPLLNFKSPTFFTKFNSLGTLSVLYLLIFVSIKAYSWGIHIPSWEITIDLKPTFCALSGMLSLSYFIHNIIISIMRHNRHQENNGRDLSVAFGLVTFTYLFIGVVFYVCFPLAKHCIEDNLLNNFEQYDPLTIIARVLLLFQLTTVFPLISFMLRADVLNNLTMIFNNRSYGEFNYTKVIILNIIMVIVYILFAIFLPRIGTLIRFTGALSGLVYIFLLPSLLKIQSLRKQQALTPVKLIFYLIVIIFGAINLLCQFFIQDL